MTEVERLASELDALQDAITRLEKVRHSVDCFKFSKYRSSAQERWAGKKHNDFVNQFDTTTSTFGRIRQKIEIAISECQLKHQLVNYSLNSVGLISSGNEG